MLASLILVTDVVAVVLLIQIVSPRRRLHVVQLRIYLLLFFYGTPFIFRRVNRRGAIHLKTVGVRLIRDARSSSFFGHNFCNLRSIVMQISLTLALTFG